MSEVVKMSTDILERRKRLLGEEDPTTLESASRCGMALFYSGDTDTAAEMLHKAYELRVGPKQCQGLNLAAHQHSPLLSRVSLS